MQLSELLFGLADISEPDLSHILNITVDGLAIDSRKVKPGDVFIALAGATQHGLVFADKALANGAIAILFDPAGNGQKLADNRTGVAFIGINQLSSILGAIAARFYNAPTEQLHVIGITGTNGKTSCSQFLGQLLDHCGIIGTLGWGDWGALNCTVNTTPDALSLQAIMADFVSANKTHVAMEASSIGLAQGRVNGVRFTGAVFTNFTRDHLDYHGTMAAYFAAKLQLLHMPGLHYAVVNLDDEHHLEILEAIPDSVAIWGVTTKGRTWASAEILAAGNISHTAEGIRFDVTWRGLPQTFNVPLYGDFNVENILCTLAVMLANGYSLNEVASKLPNLKAVPGRMERCGTATSLLNVFVDYAHTPDALDRVLSSVRKHCQQSLWVVFGCGGDRDCGKRPQMGAIAERWADAVIVTDDNPRTENSYTIAQAILSGCRKGKASLIQDRKHAIEQAIAKADDHDFIVIAGKGHEDYQEINGVRYPFSDKLIAEAALQIRFGVQ